MLRNYLKGQIGDVMNLFMACAAFNFRKFIRKMYFFASNYSEILFKKIILKSISVCKSKLTDFFRADYLDDVRFSTLLELIK
jgi:hypothetical protein